MDLLNGSRSGSKGGVELGAIQLEMAMWLRIIGGRNGIRPDIAEFVSVFTIDVFLCSTIYVAYPVIRTSPLFLKSSFLTT
jgi:hypothetical protein